MTPKSPTWGEVETFLNADGWRRVTGRGGRRQSHIFYEKTLDDRRVLQTHISHSRSATMGAGRFGGILREQLEVSKDDFWQAVQTGQPVDRPSQPGTESPVKHEPWVVRVLVGELHMTPDEIEPLSAEEAQRLVHEHWSTG